MILPMSLASLWYRPRAIVPYLDSSPRLQMLLIAAWTVAYFILGSIFILSIERVTLAPLLSLKGLLLILYSFAALGIGFVTAIYATSLALWTGARFLNGQGTLPQTRAAVVWTFVWSIPLGIFLLLIYLTIRQPDSGLFTLLIRICSYLGVLATFSYQAFVLLTTLSEVQRLGIFRSTLAAITGILLFAAALRIVIQILSR